MTETIPDGWEEKVIGDLADVFSGSSAPQEKKYFKDGKYPFIRVSDLAIKKRTNNLIVCRDYINDLAILEKKLFKAKKGTIVFPKSGAAIKNNNRAELGIDAYIVSHLCGIYANTNHSSNRFLYYFFSQLDMMDYVGDKGYPSLKTSDVKKIKILSPPIKEQEKIASILSKVDEQIQFTEEIIEKTEQLKKGLMQELLTKGIGHTEFKETELGTIPKEWEIKKGEEIYKILSGYSPVNMNCSEEGENLFLKVNDLNYLIEDKYIENSKLTFNKIDNPRTNIYEKGTIIFPKRGAAIFTNKIAILRKTGTFDTNLMGLKIFEDYSIDYIYHYLDFIKLSNISDNAGIPQINNKHIYPLNIPIPLFSEQKKISEILTNIDREIELNISELKKIKYIKKGLMQDLLTGKVRVVV